jgi:hypothetical protein
MYQGLPTRIGSLGFMQYVGSAADVLNVEGRLNMKDK